MSNPAGSSFCARHKKSVISGVVLVAVVIAVAIALPISIVKSNKREEDEVVAAPAATTADVSAAPVSSQPVSSQPPTTATPQRAVQCVYSPQVGAEAVVMDPRTPLWPVADNFTWVEGGAGITYRPDVEDPFWIVAPDDVNMRRYPFTVGVRGTYMFDMLTTSEDVSEFNDVWGKFSFGSGLRFWSHEKGAHSMTDVEGGGVEWTKLFQNQAGRALGVYTVDNEGFKIASVDELLPGQVYEFLVSGRSSKFTIHRIYAIRCEAETCAATGPAANLLNQVAEGPFTQCVRPAGT